MYPEEIGALLIERFTPYTKGFGHHSPLEPEGMAILINQELTRRYEEQMEKTKVSTSEAVNKAIAIFARYCSNATAIPSMRMRQKTRQRHDTMPTTIKESLGVWIKTDALNLLKPILSNPADNDNFKAALTAAKDNILIYFNTFEQRTIQNVTPPPTFAPVSNKITLLNAIKHLMNESSPLTGLALREAAQKYMAEYNNNIGNAGPDPALLKVQWMKEFNVAMLKEVEEFINRALLVAAHEEADPDPTSTTKRFLEEQYGDGKGVRKGTYIKGIPTSKGTMYVTEIRPKT